MQDLLTGLRALGAGRLVAMAAVAVCVFALLALLMLRGGSERMALLYGDLDMREAAQMAEQLDRQHIANQVGRQGSEILVPESMVARARLLLARDGLPSGGAIGYEIFDRGDGLVASQFQQTINQTRALEGELARTIRTMQGIRAARVHLVLPHREPFATTRQDAQASVLLTLSGANRLDHEAVQAILTLVAAAVPGLRPQNVAVVDTHGNLLARAGDSGSAAGESATLDEMRHATELRLARAVEEMLEPTLGPGRVRAEASVEMDFDQVRETQEKFDPEGQVVRGTQNVTNSSKSTEPAPATTVQNNLPNADAGAPAAGSQEQKQEETTNYEIGKTVRTLVREHPQIRRISLAVMIDGVESKDDKGSLQWHPRAAEDIDHISTLVRSAIGFDDKRGDRVDVVSMRFAADEMPDSAVAPWVLGLDKSDMMRLGQTGLLGLLGVLALLFVLRPMVLRITRMPDSGAPSLSFDAAGALASAGAAEGMALTGPQQLMLAGSSAGSPGVPALLQDDDDRAMINLANIEGQMRASSIRRLVDLVKSHPEESLSIVRAWMHQEAG